MSEWLWPLLDFFTTKSNKSLCSWNRVLTSQPIHQGPRGVQPQRSHQQQVVGNGFVVWGMGFPEPKVLWFWLDSKAQSIALENQELGSCIFEEWSRVSNPRKMSRNQNNLRDICAQNSSRSVSQKPATFNILPQTASRHNVDAYVSFFLEKLKKRIEKAMKLVYPNGEIEVSLMVPKCFYEHFTKGWQHMSQRRCTDNIISTESVWIFPSSWLPCQPSNSRKHSWQSVVIARTQYKPAWNPQFAAFMVKV